VLRRVPFPDKIEDMRRVGTEIWGLAIQLSLINKYLRAHRTEKPEPLPERVQLPELIWKPLPQAAPKEKRPPRPSPALRRKDAMERKK
jgi:hypothetical protein